MKLRTFNDLHLFSPHQISSFDEIVEAIKSCPTDTIPCSLGDIVDIKNAKYKDVPLATVQAEQLWNMFFRRVRGNHEINKVGTFLDDFEIIDGIYLCHGDREFWGQDKSHAFRSKDPGAGWFKRNLLINLEDDARCLVDPGPNKLFRQTVSYLKHTYGIRVIVCGHRHPKENLEGTIDGVKYLILRRGIQDVDV